MGKLYLFTAKKRDLRVTSAINAVLKLIKRWTNETLHLELGMNGRSTVARPTDYPLIYAKLDAGKSRTLARRAAPLAPAYNDTQALLQNCCYGNIP